MEPAKIDWKRLEWKFVEDQLYEHINAPKWVDFTSPDVSVDDEAWFCRPDCKHPKTTEDFLKLTPPKLSSSDRVLEVLPLGDRTQRDAKLKRRGLTQSSISSNYNPKFNHDSENQNPNFSTPPPYQIKSTKATFKSSTEKKPPVDHMQPNEDPPSLKSTLSAKNLFAGRDILSHITEFCNELKRMATRARERENVEKLNVKNDLEAVKDEMMVEEEGDTAVSGELEIEGKERKPFVELGKEKLAARNSISVVKQKQSSLKRANEVENVPISLDLENVKCKREESLLQIRTNPPSPQCFSAPNKITPPKPSKSRIMKERGVLKEVEQDKQKQMVKREECGEKGKSISIVDGRETRTLDVFWFLKPCTNLST